MDIDVRSNKYFTSFTISSNGQTGDDAKYTAITTGNGDASGINLTIMGQPKEAISFQEEGLNN